MNKKFSIIILSLLAFFLAPIVCVAETATDYKCLKGCRDNGDSNMICISKCSYDTSEQQPSSNHTGMAHGCLKACMDKGGAVATCVPGCTAKSNPVSNATSNTNSHIDAASAHDILKAPLPYEGLKLKPTTHIEQEPSVDYTCLKLCTEGGLQYPLCRQRCEK